MPIFGLLIFFLIIFFPSPVDIYINSGDDIIDYLSI